MNNDQVKGTVKKMAGKIQEAAGKLAGNKELQTKGINHQLAGKAQKNYGDAKEVIKQAVHHF